MATPHLDVAPVLSTPESHIFEDPTPIFDVSKLPQLSDEQLAITYEIERTVKEVRDGRWKRIALQFPDDMLKDSVRVYEGLRRGLAREREKLRLEGEKKESSNAPEEEGIEENLEKDMGNVHLEDGPDDSEEEKLCILADTSYGACCVDEIAAEHTEAEVVIHYGRSCLSPTVRLPVIYVFTSRPISMDSTIEAFKQIYSGRAQKIILMADIPFSSHISEMFDILQKGGYANIHATSIIHDPSSPLPNRTVPDEISSDASMLKDYQIFHIGPPPTALLLTLSSRVGAIHIYDPVTPSSKAILSTSAQTLRRRYALLTSLSTVSIFGILINTLSVKNYLHIVEHVKSQIVAAGKKSYTFVVGKINAAKIANFSEIGGWVVIGCWESSLAESREFYRPVITPFELGLCLKGDKERTWTGEWSSDFQAILKDGEKIGEATTGAVEYGEDGESDEDSAPPEFDLRTGRYVSHSRPMRTSGSNASSTAMNRPRIAQTEQQASGSLIKRANGDVTQIGGVVSPGAEFLRRDRTWQGLGSDFEIAYQEDGALIEEGRSGIARGYVVGEQSGRR